VNGDVYIDSPGITFANGWSVYPTNNVPALYVIAKGNIYIHPNVTRIDGVYVAQPGASPGIIYTCANHAPPYTSGELAGTCLNRQLTINGAFVAQGVRLQRAFSSLRHGVPTTESPISAAHPCDVQNGVYTNPQPVCGAEVFNVDPVIYLAYPPMAPDTNKRYDAITSASPVL
jgi:hypothetical protein